jgi:hypothetical protein
MTSKSDWQEANRRLTAEQRANLGDPPSAEQMLAYSRGELSADEEERIRELLVAYPELARMYGASFPDEAQPDVSNDAVTAGFADLQRRLGATPVVARRPPVRHYIPTTLAAALALVFFGLYVQAESRARDHARGCDVPRVLGAPQELDPNENRGSGAPILLRKDGDAYLLKPALVNQLRSAHYTIELLDRTGVVWTSRSADPDEHDTFQIVIPHAFLRVAEKYQLRIYGIDGKTRRLAGSYNVEVPSE